MSASKHIDKICAIITIVAVMVTVLFMNGNAIGMTLDARMRFAEQCKAFCRYSTTDCNKQYITV